MEEVIREILIAGRGPYHKRALYAFKRMSDEERAAVGRAFARHVKACESLGIEIDPGWLHEAIGDAAEMRIEN